MGWNPFKSKKKTYVSTSVSHLIPETEQIDINKQTVFNAVSKGAGITDSIVNGLLHGGGVQLLQMYRWARDYYHYGLPSGDTTSNDFNENDIKTVLFNIEEGRQINLLSVNYGVPDFDSFVELYIVDKYGLDTEGLMRNPPDNVPKNAVISVKLTNLKEGFIQYFVDDLSDIAIYEEPITFSLNLNSNYYLVVYSSEELLSEEETVETIPYVEGMDLAPQRSYKVTVTEEGETKTLIEIVYEPTENGVDKITKTTITNLTYPKTFTYISGSGKYPILDKRELEPTKSQYLPIVPVRVGNRNYLSPSVVGDKAYKSSAKAIKKMGFKVDDISNSINNDPQVGEIDYAFLVMGISLNTQMNDSKEYLLRFFDFMSINAKTTALDWLEYEEYVLAPLEVVEITKYGRKFTQTIPKKFKPKPVGNTLGFNLSAHSNRITFDYASKRTVDGYVTKKGKCITRITNIKRSYLYIAIVTDSDGRDQSQVVTRTETVPVFQICKQITENTYTEVSVYNLNLTNYIEGHTTTISASGSLANLSNKEFIIPLHYAVLKKMPLSKLNQLCIDCFYMRVNTIQVVKIKWYYKFIKIVLIIVAVVVAIYGGYAATSSIISAASSAAAAGATATGVAIAVGGVLLEQIAIGLVVSIGLKMAISALPDNLAIIFAIVAVVVAMYAGTVGSETFTGANFNLPWANDVISSIPSLSGSIIKGATDGVNSLYANNIGDLMAERESYMAEFEKQMKKITDLMEEFNTRVKLDTVGIAKYSYYNLFESPDTFFLRTLNSDVSASCLDAVSTYCTRMLNIPIGEAPKQ